MGTPKELGAVAILSLGGSSIIALARTSPLHIKGMV